MSLNHFRVIQGSFLIKGFRPDGDSVRFLAQDPSRFSGLYRDFRDEGKSGPRQVRMEGMDAPETHYGVHAQPFGVRAREGMLGHLGFTSVEMAEEVVSGSHPEVIGGAILTQAFDPHGRPISYVLAGAAAEGLQDGAEIAIGTDLLERTINARMIRDGLAYPLLYTSAPPEHREFFRQAAHEARARGLGLWPLDGTSSFQLDQGSLVPGSGRLIFPKFFRRCMDYLEAAPGSTLPAWLGANPDHNDQLLLRGTEVRLAELFEQQQQRVLVKSDLLDLVFIEK